jgi:pyruvate kinase
MLEKALKAGVDAVRINFSHGTHEQHARYVAMVRDTAKRLDVSCSLLADLTGPRIRVDKQTYGFPQGAEIQLCRGKGNPDQGRIGISTTTWFGRTKPGQRILFDDGKLEAEWKTQKGSNGICEVVRGGILKPGKAVNVPGVDLGLPILSKKDLDDLEFIRKADFDWIAASFVRDKKDILTIRRRLADLGIDAKLISKVESAQAVDHLRDIVEFSDGILVARGDLGVELPLERIPTVQRTLIHLGTELGKVTIVATQMLETMIENPRPTRAEVTDMSTAALARVDALMLSGETAAGKYPIEAITMMDKVIRVAEANIEENLVSVIHDEAIALTCEAGMYFSQISGAKALVTISTHGTTPRLLSTYRSSIPIVVACTNPSIFNRSALYHGVLPIRVEAVKETEPAFKEIEKDLKRMGLVEKGDVIVIVFGFPFHGRNRTNTLRRWEVS